MNYFQETSISYCQVQTIDALGIAFLSLSLFPPIHMSFLFKMDKASQKRSSHELFLAKKYSYPFSPSVPLLSLQDKLLCDINVVECWKTEIDEGRYMLQSLILFSLFAWGEMAKANQTTRRHADGCNPHIVRSLNKRRLEHISLLFLPLSVHLSPSQDGQSFPLLNTATAQGGPQGNNASTSLQRTSTRKVSGTRRSTGESLYVKCWS